MVVVKIGDGMGNQLYNYACGYAVARHDHDTLMIDTSECDNSGFRNFELDKFHLKYDKRESFPNKYLFQKIYKRLRRNLKYHVIIERAPIAKDGQYNADGIDTRVYKKKKIRNKYLHGYWQNFGYFEEYLGEILEMMTPAYEQTENVKELIKRLQSTSSCALHVRDGDIPGAMRPSDSYFLHAIEGMEEGRPNINYIVFSDNQEAARKMIDQIIREATIKDRIRYVTDLGCFSDVDEFFLMAACQNQICSSSTYSIWAAYLNPNPDKLVFVPRGNDNRKRKMKDWRILD